MRLSTKIAYNTIIQVISKVISTILGLAAIAIITRSLGSEGFGQYTTITTFLAFFAIAADFGLTLITVQMISQPKADEKKILGNLLALRLVSALLFLGLAPLTVFFFPYSSSIKMGVIVTSFSFLFIALNQILVGLFQKNLRMDKVSIAEVVSRIFLIIGVIISVKADAGLLGILLATVASSAINFFLHYIFSLSFIRIKLYFDFNLWKQIIIKSWPLALTITLNLIYLKTDTLLLSLIKRPSEIGIISEVGIYGAAYKVIDVLITFPFMFAGIVLPLMTLAYAQNDKKRFNKIVQKSFNVMIIFAIPLTIGTQFLAKDVMILVGGSDFALSGPILQILIMAASLIFLGNIFAHAIIAIDKQKKIISTYLFTAITSLVGYLIFIPKFSYFGAAWVTIYSEMVVSFMSIFLVWKYTKFFPNLAIVFKSLAASLIMAAALYALYTIQGYNMITVLLISVAVYFIFLYIFKGLTKQDILDLLNK